jgi:acyl carrier protein
MSNQKLEGNVKAAVIKEEVLGFIRSNFMFDNGAAVEDDQSLLGSGIVDSTGILELISFLESKYGIKFRDEELVADNFDSLRSISEFVTTRRSEVTP